MHEFIAFLLASTLAFVFAVAVLFVAYFAYRARRARERLEVQRPADPGPQVDPIEEFRRLGQEIHGSLLRAGETADRMRDTVERGVR